MEYLDDVGAGNPLLPADARARARHRELSRYSDLKLELAARALYPFVGKGVGDAEPTASLTAALVRNVALLAGLASPAPFLTGTAPSLGDCALMPAANALVIMERYLPLPLPWPRWFAGYRSAIRDLPGVAPILDAQLVALDDWARGRLAAA